MDWTYHSLGDLVDYLDSIGWGPCPDRDRRHRRDNLRKKWRDSGMSKTDWFNVYLKGKVKMESGSNMYYSGNGMWTVFPVQPTTEEIGSSHTHSYSLDSCSTTCVAPCAKAKSVPVTIKSQSKKGKDMDYRENDWGDDTAVSLAAKKVEYLQSRLSNITWEKRNELEKKFGLRDDDRPRTLKEALERIAQGKITYDEKKAEKDTYDPLNLIRWRDPSVKEDQAGYRAANDLLDKENTKVSDLIQIGEPKDALAAIQALENWQPTGVAN